jgi:hypothetical protein
VHRYCVRTFEDWGVDTDTDSGQKEAQSIDAGMLLGDVSAFSTKAESMRFAARQEDMVAHARRSSNPFDAHVVEAVKRAMKHV